MKKNLLVKINAFVCLIIVLGFCVTSLISYHSNKGIFERDVEQVSQLLSEGVYHRIDSMFAKPVHISLTMANDRLLQSFLLQEKEQPEDEVFLDNMQRYLLAYQEKYAYDSVFLVSTATNRYYHYNGLDRVLTEDNPENVWYYNFLASDAEYNVVIDNDEVAHANNAITIFINCKIRDESGDVLGVVGVGFATSYIQDLLRSYEEEFDVQIYLIDKAGTIEISNDQTGFESVNLYETGLYGDFSSVLAPDALQAPSFWYDDQQSGYIITQYIPTLDWYLVIDNNTAALNAQLRQQFIWSVAIIIAVVVFVLLVITGIIRRYNSQIVELTVAREQEHRTLFQTATEKIYENIYEVDITHNCVASEETEAYFASLGVPPGTPYDQALELIANQQIKEEFREGYINTLKPEHILSAYESGLENLSYEFLITHDEQSYYWVRITTHIFYWDDDQSIRMFVYRQNIDEEKQRQKRLNEQLQRDSLTGLYNKAATQSYIQKALREEPELDHAFFILDIDNFKQVNDTLGHAVGDAVIADFAKVLKSQFRPGDVVGRIGGDEFAVFIPLASPQQVQDKAEKLLAALRYTYTDGIVQHQITPSIGIALAPEAGSDFETLYKNADFALYRTKKNGKNNYTIYTRS